MTQNQSPQTGIKIQKIDQDCCHKIDAQVTTATILQLSCCFIWLGSEILSRRDNNSLFCFVVVVVVVVVVFLGNSRTASQRERNNGTSRFEPSRTLDCAAELGTFGPQQQGPARRLQQRFSMAANANETLPDTFCPKADGGRNASSSNNRIAGTT